MIQPLDDLYALIRQLEAASPAPVTEFRFTREQWHTIRAETDARSMYMASGSPTPDIWNPSALYGVPVRIVDDIRESTPYLHGWSWAGQPREPFRAPVAGWYGLRDGVISVERMREAMLLPNGSFREAVGRHPVPPDGPPYTHRFTQSFPPSTPTLSIEDERHDPHLRTATVTVGIDPARPTDSTAAGKRDIIDAIDEAIACQAEGCSRPIPEDGPSDDFCSAACQQKWHEARCELPLDYEPAEYDTSLADRFNAPESATDRDLLEPPAHVTEMLRQYWLRYQRSLHTGSLSGPFYYTVTAVNAEGEDVPVALSAPVARGDTQLFLSTPLPADAVGAVLTVDEGTPRETRARVVQVSARMATVEWLVDEPLPVEADHEPADPMQRALEMRRNRDTGPARRQRPPRSLRPGRRR